jgi:hypothetical protein
MVGVIAVNLTARHRERVPAWPGSARPLWVLGAVALAGVAAWAAVTAGRRAFPSLAVGAVVLGVILVAAWPIARHARARWYVGAGLPLDEVNAALHDVRDSSVAFFGTTESYPFYGRDLSNRVDRPSGPRPDAPPEQCREWANRLAGYGYVVIARQPFAFEGPPESLLARDPAAVRLAGDDEGSVYRLDAPLTGTGC